MPTTTPLRTMASAKAAKAYVAAAVAALSAAVPLVDDGLTSSEVLGVIAAALVAFQTVYWTTNRGAAAGEGNSGG